jgi:2-C-methyl-D-erythritol 2,4-cyclodiphosphate synthase
LASDLGLDIAQINLKAKTNEHLGWEGREEGIAVQAIALLEME